MQSRSVVITGSGAFTGNATCTSEFAETLRRGETAIRPLLGTDRWPISGGAVVNPDALAGRLRASHARDQDRDYQLAACVLEEALDSAGLASHATRASAAVVVGSVQYRGRARMAERLADEYRLGRPRIVIDAACSAGAHALGIAAQLVRSGVAPIAVAVGYNHLQGKDVLGLYKLGILTRERIRPFDRLRSGTQPGEGGAALVVEDASHALQRGAPIQAELAGFGSSADAHQIVAPDLAGIGVSIAVRSALAQAGIAANQIDYLNAHGTGTKLNDPSETAGLRRALGRERLPRPHQLHQAHHRTHARRGGNHRSRRRPAGHPL